MGADQNFDWAQAAASALDWWRDAGVDVLVEDAPRDWRAAPASVAPPPTAPVAERPTTLAEFIAWRIGDAAPERGWAGRMIAAEGPLDAAMMVLVDCPDREDERDARLLQGAPGRLFDRMLAAVGLTRAEIHLASVCAARPAGGRARDREQQLHDLARHHVALAAPRRLLVLGDAASRALLGTEVVGTRESLHSVNHPHGTTEVVASFHPRMLIERPGLKAQAWRDLRRWVGEVGA